MSDEESRSESIAIRIDGRLEEFNGVNAFVVWMYEIIDEIKEIGDRVFAGNEVNNDLLSQQLIDFIDENIQFYSISIIIMESYRDKVQIDSYWRTKDAIINIIESNKYVMNPRSDGFGVFYNAIYSNDLDKAHNYVLSVAEKGRFDLYEFFDLFPELRSVGRKTFGSKMVQVGPGSKFVATAEYIDEKIAEAITSAIESLADPEKLIAERESAEKILVATKSKWAKLEAEMTAAHKSLNEEIETATAEMRDTLKTHSEHAAKTLVDLSKRTGELKGSLEDVVAFGEQSLESFEESAKIRGAEHEETMDGMEAAFRARLELEAPAQLWDEKAKQHRESASSRIKCAVGVTLVFGIAVLAGLAAVINFDLFGVTKTPDLALALLLAVPLVCGFVIIRVLFRMYSLSQALADDSEHRSALMKSFLALSTETGGGLKDEERLIVLHALFRPTDLSGAQDGAQIHHLFEVAAKRVVGGDKSPAG